MRHLPLEAVDVVFARVIDVSQNQSGDEHRQEARAVSDRGHPDHQGDTRRAVVHLPISELRRVSEGPYPDIVAGDCESLANAELRRIGVRPGSVQERA